MRVFVSAAAVVNPIGGVANADAKCQAFADAQRLGGTWKAWISDTSGSVSTRFVHATVPYRLLDGTLVANDWNDLVDGTIARAIDIDETGATRVAAGGLPVWTATDTTGAGFVDEQCTNWTNGAASAPSPFVGRNDATDTNWTMAAQQTCDATSLHLYCVEQPAAPAPGPGPTNCPSSVDFTSPSVDVVHGGPGGAPRSYLCPSGQVAIGYTLYEDTGVFGGVVAGLAAVCGKISVAQASCQLTVAPSTTFPLDGTTGSAGPFSSICPANQVVAAIQGRSGALVDQLSVGCATLTLTKVGSSYQATVGTITWIPPIGGTGGSPFTGNCPTGQVATGTDVHSGFELDALGLLCAKPVLVP
jgi:hypothetical protein